VGKVQADQKAASGLKSESAVVEIEIVPDPRCVQLFVPGMRDKSLARKAVSVISCTKMEDSEALAGGEIEVFLRSVAAS
jgi:hypothetical protein